MWNANSLGECRQIIAERWGEGATGACWAMVKARWHQYIFGFYPQYLYWRPTLAFCLLFVALAPVLYTALPRKIQITGPDTRLTVVVSRWQPEPPPATDPAPAAAP